MRRRILHHWLRRHAFAETAGVATLLIDDAVEDDTAARSLINRAEHLHATEMLRDRVLYPLLDTAAQQRRDLESQGF